MKVLLIQPPKARASLAGEDFYTYEPLALEAVAASAADHHDLRLLDMRFEPDLGRTLDDFEPDVVGVTAYTVHVNPALAICDEVKRRNPRTMTVVGGHHATVRPHDFAKASVDVVVEGDGQVPFRTLLERKERGEGLGGIPGVHEVVDGALRGTPPDPAADLDSCPFPSRRLSATYRSRYFSEWMRPLATIRTSRGCPFRCSFCALWRLTGGRVLHRDPERIVEELRGIEEPFVFFADDESMVDAKGMQKLAEVLEREGVRKRYFCYGRSDTIARHPELLARWRDLGLERIFVGLEFFRDEDLAYVNKKSSVKLNEQALRILADLGIDVYASFIIRPEFTREDFSAFRSYCRSLPLGFASFAVLTPLPGTKLYEEREGDLISRNWDHFDFLHALLPTKLPLPEFYEQYARLLEGAVPLRKGLRFLGRFPLREVPGFVSRGRRLLRRIREAWKDHEAPGGPGGPDGPAA